MTESDRSDVTALLGDWRNGEQRARERVLELLYDELRGLARHHMRGERVDHTLQPTALLHEAYQRLVNVELDFESRSHFVSMAARTMRRVLVDHARARAAGKRQGQLRVTLPDADQLPAATSPCTVIDLHLALERLHDVDERQADALELHYFGGLRYDEIASALGTSEATVGRDIRHGKAWLRHQLRGAPPDGS